MGKQAGKIALGLGILTGAITGLLFAPDEGKNIRKKIAKGDAKGLLKDLENMGDEMKQMVVDLTRNPGVQDLIERGKDLAADAVNVKRAELDKMLHKANEKAETFKKTVAKYVKEQKAALDERLTKQRGGKRRKKKGSVKKSVGRKSPKRIKATKKK